MKTNDLTILISAAFTLAAFSTAGCAEKAQVPDGNVPPVNATAPAAPPPAEVPRTGADKLDVASAAWIDIKDCTFETRAQFFAGLKRLEAKVERQVGELTAKRATMNSTVETKNWDFAMEAMNSARSYLKSMGEESIGATLETWTQKKEKVGQAWQRTQDAYGKVLSSTTS